MRSHPPADVHANRRQLFFGVLAPHPNSCFSGDALRGNSKFRRGANHCFFEHAHIPNYVAPDRAQIQNRIPHNLSRPMIRNVATAIRGMKLHALLL
jgi:hypothetical protein